jgi:hypothetical protein
LPLAHHARLELVAIKVEVRRQTHAQQQLAQRLLHQLRAVASRGLQLAFHLLQAPLGVGIPAGMGRYVAAERQHQSLFALSHGSSR